MNNLESKETVKADLPELRAWSSHERGNLRRKNGYQVAIVDFDGTLADSIYWFLGVINEVAGAYRFRRIKEQELPQLRTFDARRMLEHLGIPKWKLLLVQRHVRKR